MNRASAGGELVSLSVSLPPSIVCVTLADTGRARQPETVDSGLDGGSLSVSCSPNQSDVRRDKVQLYFLLCSAARKQKGSASVCSHSSAVLWHQLRPDPPICKLPVLVPFGSLFVVTLVRTLNSHSRGHICGCQKYVLNFCFSCTDCQHPEEPEGSLPEIRT